MSRVPQKNIDAVVNALEEFHNRMVETQQFNLQEFFNFMEPKFAEAGYRDTTTPPRCRSNILIIHDCGAGDFVVQTGLIREVRRIYPEAYITLMVSPVAFELAEHCPYADEIIPNLKQFAFTQNFIELYKWCADLSKQLLKNRIDVCYAVAHNPCTPFLMYMCGARSRVSHYIADEKEATWCQDGEVPVPYSLQLATNLFPMFAYGKHAVDICFSLLDHTLHSPVANRSLEIWYTAFEMNIAKSILENAKQKVYALTMGGSGLNRHYPPEKYARLLEIILREDPTATFVILGAGQNDLISAEIVKNTAPEIYEKHVIDLTNRINYRRSAAILSLCDMYIGNDTGTMHVAAAVKCPVLLVSCYSANFPFSHNVSISKYRPYLVPSVVIQPKKALPECEINEPYNHWGCRSMKPHCITQIEPETVYSGFKLLNQRIAEKNIETVYIS